MHHRPSKQSPLLGHDRRTRGGGGSRNQPNPTQPADDDGLDGRMERQTSGPGRGGAPAAAGRVVTGQGQPGPAPGTGEINQGSFFLCESKETATNFFPFSFIIFFLRPDPALRMRCTQRHLCTPKRNMDEKRTEPTQTEPQPVARRWRWMDGWGGRTHWSGAGFLGTFPTCWAGPALGTVGIQSQGELPRFGKGDGLMGGITSAFVRVFGGSRRNGGNLGRVVSG